MKKIAVVLCLLLSMGSCKKEALKDPLIKEPLLMRSANEAISANYVSLSQTNISAEALPVISEWDTSYILKTKLPVTDQLDLYFIKSLDGARELMMISNNQTNEVVKVNIGTQVIDGLSRYTYYSDEGIQYFAITLKPDIDYNYLGYDMAVGERLPINKDIIPNPGRVDLLCSRTKGFGSCVTCSASECTESWICLTACTLGPEACLAGWLVACAILNPPKAQIPINENGRTKLIIVKPLLILDSLNN